jgi:chloramphenicol 3-O-phosphotransferase
MLVPSKFTRLEESTLFRMKSIMSGRSNGETVQDVYYRTRNVFHDASEFLHALDILFVLGIVNVDADSGVIQYA